VLDDLDLHSDSDRSSVFSVFWVEASLEFSFVLLNMLLFSVHDFIYFILNWQTFGFHVVKKF
jgi:hypothetical protein